MRKLLIPSLTLLLAVSLTAAGAQDYRFSVPRMELFVVVNPDASVTMNYEVDFVGQRGAKAIDIVDIGLPHRGYDLGNMKATMNGQSATRILPSEFVKPGVEIHLANPLPPEQKGTLDFTCQMPDLVYQDTTRADYASLRITPTWFGSEFLVGNTDLLIVVVLPDGIELDEILYQQEPFTNKAQLKGSKAVFWHYPDTRLSKAHMVGVSFPQRDLERVVRMTRLGLLYKWWSDNPLTRFWLGTVFLVLFSIFFFRFTRGTGCSLWGILVIGLIIAWSVSPGLHLAFLPIFIPAWVLGERSLKRRRGKYLPAIASTPGGGIKRGLNVPEAAVLMEAPLGRVLTLVLFGMLKKGFVKLEQDDPLTVSVVPEYDTEPQERRKVARENGKAIRAYEQRFLDVLRENPDKSAAEINFQPAMKYLIESTAKRMAGFNVEETKEYYLSIVTKAWQDAKGLGDVEQRTDHVDQNLDWMLLAPGYHDNFNHWHRRGYVYRPIWARTGPVGGAAASPLPATPGARTGFGDVAASFAGWAENTSGSLARTLDPVSLGTAHTGGLNLSGLDKVTGEALKAMSESSGSGRGGGGGCACAGCACACACAGGGR